MKKPNAQDRIIYLLLIAVGALAFVLSPRTQDFVADVYYVELAKSIAAGKGYVFNFRPQTMVPPGFPYLLVLITKAVGSGYVTLVRSMAVFSTIALIASYEVLRSQERRWAAAAICLLAGSSPDVFRFSTTLVFSDMPYFCTSMILLWLVMRLDSAGLRLWERTLLWLLSCAMMILSVLMRSTGIALAGGVLAWIVVSCVREPQTARRRIGIFLPLVLVGVAALGAWMHWATAHQVYEWPIHGYQENYLAQLKLRSGNVPELGMANWQDVLLRPVHNADDIAAALTGLVTRKEMAPAWYSPGTVIPLALVLVGLGESIFRNGGGLLEWYFVTYEAMFLIWPWDFELRFVLPVLPLALLYLWRGGTRLWRLAQERPRAAGASVALIAVAGCLGSIAWGRGVEHPAVRSCVALWVMTAVVSMGISYFGRDRKRKSSILPEKTASAGGNRTDTPLRNVSVRNVSVRNISVRNISVRNISVRNISLRNVSGTALVTALILLGIVMQVRRGRENIHFDPKTDGSYPNIEAAEWIQGHSAASAVVMARKEDLVFHYARRRVIWFPPSSNPQILMDGIRRYHVRYVVAVEGDNYWRPTSEECFNTLLRAYPADFQLVHQGPRNRVFAVVETHDIPPHTSSPGSPS